MNGWIEDQLLPTQTSEHQAHFVINALFPQAGLCGNGLSISLLLVEPNMATIEIPQTIYVKEEDPVAEKKKLSGVAKRKFRK